MQIEVHGTVINLADSMARQMHYAVALALTRTAHKHKLSRPKFERRREPELAMAEEVAGYGVPDDAMGYGLPPGHFAKAILTPRKNKPRAEHPHEPPRPPKNYGANINTLIELLESGRL